MMSKLTDVAATARDWLMDAAVPLWAEHGLDRARGGFFESLTGDFTSVAAFKRLRVVTRQIYVFSAAHRLGFPGARAVIDHGLDFLFSKARHPDGGFASKFDLDGNIIDGTRDCYDLAFVLFSLAHAYNVTGDEKLKSEAHDLIAFMQANMTHPSGGFIEQIPEKLPRRQNPHMHLLEAVLAWSAVDPDGPFPAVRDQLLDLFETRFLDRTRGYLPEYFDNDLNVAEGPTGETFEPGHHFEWAWLLEQAGGHDDSRALLYASGIAKGISPQTGFPYGEVKHDGTVVAATPRLWTLTEWLKAEAVTSGKDFGGEDQAARVAKVWAGIEQFLATPTHGLWRERWDADAGAFADEPSPATTLYHLTLGIEVLIEAAGLHPAPFGK